MTRSPLHSARLKLARAQELLAEIETDYTTRNAARLRDRMQLAAGRTNIDIQTEAVIQAGRVLSQETWYVVKMPEDPPEPLERWGLLAGDAMHNTRSALDHLACRLVELAGRPVSKRTAFPIWGTEPKTRRERGRFRETVRGMSAAHKDSLVRLQPFSNLGTVEAIRLLTLAALDNLDKHTILVPINSVISGANLPAPQVQSERPGEIQVVWNVGAVCKKGEEIFRFRALSDIGAVYDLNFRVPIRPSFGDAQTGLGDLKEIRSYVVGIIESFAPELGQSAEVERPWFLH